MILLLGLIISLHHYVQQFRTKETIPTLQFNLKSSLLTLYIYYICLTCHFYILLATMLHSTQIQ